MRDEEINQNSFIYLLYTVDFYRSRAYPENTGCATGIHQSITAPCTPNRTKRQFTFNPTADIFRDRRIHTKSTQTQEKHMKLHTDSNLNSGTYQVPKDLRYVWVFLMKKKNVLTGLLSGPVKQ